MPQDPTQPQSLISRPDFQLVSSRGFMEWMTSVPLSLALTTYHVGGVIMLGSKPGGAASMHVAAFDRSMGCWTDGQTMWLVTERMLWRLENNLADGQIEDGYDRVFAPRVGYATGEIDGHEVAVANDGQPVFVNTAFSCLATVDERFSFRPLWHPPFISQLAPEDRCHLSGLALADGQPKYVTMHARSDVADGWRDFREHGGVVMDVQTNAIVAEQLSMPHSPRVREGRLWLLNSGTGHLGFIDPKAGKFEPVTFVPGYARGLAFYGDWAIVGLSKPRREHAFQGLALEKNLADRGAAPRCGLSVIDLKTGAILHWARIESVIEELFDLAVLPGVQRPKTLSFTSSSYARQISFAHEGRLQRWTVGSELSAPGKTHSPNPLSNSVAAQTPARHGERPDIMAPRRTPQNTAKAWNNLGLSHTEQGELDEARRCFEQAISLDAQHAGAQNNLGNVLRQQEHWDQAIECYRRALAADPNYARAYFNLGQVLVQLGRLPEASGCFRRTLAIEPQHVDAGVCLGMVLKDQGKLDEATQCFNQALKLDPQSWSAYNGLGLVHKERDELEAAVHCYDQALQFNPQSSAALANKGSALRELNQLDEALACYDRAIECDPECVAAHHNRSMLRLLVGDCQNGWPEYEWRWKQPLREARYRDLPRWDGSPLKGRTILLHSEQGLGDTLQFIRYAPLVAERGGRVVLQCQPALTELLKSCAGISRIVDNDSDPGEFDCQLPLLSLPLVFGTTLDTIPSASPYLRAEDRLVQHWKQRMRSGLKVGIVWQGNRDYPGDRSRSIPLVEFAPLAQVAQITLVSLQVGFGSEQVSELAGRFPVLEPNGPGNPGLDFANTAALIRNLDLVIAPNTAICHLAGALAAQVWVPLSVASDWRFLLDREDTPWYPSMRLFRQSERGNWATVMQRMAREL